MQWDPYLTKLREIENELAPFSPAAEADAAHLSACCSAVFELLNQVRAEAQSTDLGPLDQHDYASLLLHLDDLGVRACLMHARQVRARSEAARVRAEQLRHIATGLGR